MSTAVKIRYLLAGLPSVLPLESPSSWITRAALSQGATLREFKHFLCIPRESDPDQFVAEQGMNAVVDWGLERGHFEVARRVILSAMLLEQQGLRVLLRTENGKPRYRFCPACLAAERTPYFGIHCRVLYWCHCPVHRCWMEDNCPHCRRQVVLPVGLVKPGSEKLGIGHLGQCLRCAKSLAALRPLPLQNEDATDLTAMDQSRLHNGRALLSALFFGRLGFSADRSMRIGELHRLARMGLLPSLDWPPSRAEEAASPPPRGSC